VKVETPVNLWLRQRLDEESAYRFCLSSRTDASYQLGFASHLAAFRKGISQELVVLLDSVIDKVGGD